MNSFHACPVAYDRTKVGTMSLSAWGGRTPLSLSFKPPEGTTKFNGVAADKKRSEEGGFTWPVNSAWNEDVEDRPGRRQHWVWVGQKLEDDAGLDISDEFERGMPGGREDGAWGPFYFDFKAPVPGDIHIGGSSVVAGTHYSDKAYPDKSTNTIALSSVTDMGAGVDSATIMIAVGDCSAADNNVAVPAAQMPDRKDPEMKFDAEYPSVSHISDLAEEDANRDGPGKDSKRLDCYVAELTALADKLGNEFDGGKTPAGWKQTFNFGVDKTAPSMTEERPRNGFVFNELPELDFVFDNPDLGSGDAGTDIEWSVKMAAASLGRGADPVDAGEVDTTTDDREVVVDLDEAVVTAEEEDKTITVTASDGAVPPNTDSHTWVFAWDETDPTYSISRTQGDIGTTGASSVNASVAGTISDANEIESATLRLLLREYDAANNTYAECYNGSLDDLEALEDIGDDASADSVAMRDAVIPSRVARPGHARALENGTNSIAFDQVFVVSKPEGSVTAAEGFCFRLDVEDEARNEQARAASTGNTAKYADVGEFKVEWPRVSPPVKVNEIADVNVMKGATRTVNFADNFSSPDGDPLTYTSSSSDETVATVEHTGTVATIEGVEVGTADITITATDNEGSATQTFTVTVERVPGPTFTFHTADDNGTPTTFTAADSLRVAEGTEASANIGYWVRLAKVKTAPTASAPVTVTVTAPPGLSVTPATLSFTANDSALVTVAAVHDLNIRSELLSVNHTATGYDEKPFRVRVMDDDVLIEVTNVPSRSVHEDADSTTVIIRATAGTAPTDAAGLNVDLTATGTGGAVGGDFRITSDGDGGNAINIPMGMTSAIDTVYVTALDDAEMNEVGEAIEFSDTGKATVTGQYAMPDRLTIIDADPDISVTPSDTSLDEGSGATVVTVTAELDAAPNEILTFTIGTFSGAQCTGDVVTSVAGPVFRMGPAETSASGTVTVTPAANINGGNVNCTVPVTVEPAAKQGGTINWTLQAVELTIVNADDSSS